MSSQQCRFLDLPFEIRERIYHHLFSSSPSIRLVHISKLRLRNDQKTHLRPFRPLSRKPAYPPLERRADESDYGWADIGSNGEIDSLVRNYAWDEKARFAYRDWSSATDILPGGVAVPDCPHRCFLAEGEGLFWQINISGHTKG